ncbi:MAG: hypothetical protein M3O01_09510 [Pseudomonadota bacterium]|nr:hypothetical protein [Pseudomonadota bacterium]
MKTRRVLATLATTLGVALAALPAEASRAADRVGSAVDLADVAGGTFGSLFGAPSFASGLHGVVRTGDRSATSPGALGAQATATVNFASGGTDRLALDVVANAELDGLLRIFGGPDRTGRLLAEFNLDAGLKSGVWQHLVVPFAGVAQSVGFDIKVGEVQVDQLVVGAVPESDTYALLGLGLAAVACATYRRRSRP